MGGSLRELRLKAGYRNGKDLAEALGMPASSYSRYESAPEQIPLRHAWAIADFLGCTIDEVVGREPTADSPAQGRVQHAYDDLSDEGRRMVDDYLGYVQMVEEREGRRRAEGEARDYELHARAYERQFLEECEREATLFGDPLFMSPHVARREFRSFLEEKAAEVRVGEQDPRFEAVRAALMAGGSPRGVSVPEEWRGRPLTEEEATRVAEAWDEEQMQRLRDRNEEVIGKIMEAYDRLHGTGYVEYSSEPLALVP